MPPSAAIAQPMFTVNQETVIRNAFPPHPDRKRARYESDSFRSAAAVRSSASACPMQALIAV